MMNFCARYRSRTAVPLEDATRRTREISGLARLRLAMREKELLNERFEDL